jgi:hypothetical protein
MPQYFFDVINGHQVLDRRGLNLRDAAAASTEAHHVASSLALLQRGLGGRAAGGRVVVVDEHGDEILAVSVPSS